MQDIPAAPATMLTTIPGRQPIELVAWYEEFRDYYPLCELETKRWFVEHVQPDWWILDVGANIGYYTILFSQLAPQGRVFAFEPTTTAAMLRRNLEHNDVRNAEIHEIALGAKTGRQRERIFRIWGTEGEVADYPFCRLDDFVREHGLARVDCLKIDVDSFDFDVLRGAEQTLSRHDPVIVVELNHALARRDQSGAEALAWLARRGYRKALVLDRYDNFVLQRREGIHSGLEGVAGMELMFPPPVRVDERPQAGGQALGRSFVRTGELLGGAALRRDAGAGHLTLWDRIVRPRSGPPAQGRVRFEDIVDRAIETAPDRWSYALLLHLEAPGNDDTLSITVGVEVVAGALGIVVCGEDLSRFSAPERVLAAMPGRQNVVIDVRRDAARALVFRNAGDDGSATLFKLSTVQGKTFTAR